MRAARVVRIGAAPSVIEVETPRAAARGRALLRVKAAALNPVTLAVAAGAHYGGAPKAPYTPGTEGVGVVVSGDSLSPGSRVRFEANESEGGSLAEFCAVDEETCAELPQDVSDSLAAGLGVAGLAAWLALRDSLRLRAGESLLILGATGVVGQIAIQAARIMGAGQITAVGRDAAALRRCLDLGADSIVELNPTQGPEELSLALSQAHGGPIELVLDGLWGVPAEAALLAAAPFGRFVNLGQSASAEAVVRSGDIRGRMLTISGHSNRNVAASTRVTAFQDLLHHARAGRIRIEVAQLPLSDIERAWGLQSASPHQKVVITLD